MYPVENMKPFPTLPLISMYTPVEMLLEAIGWTRHVYMYLYWIGGENLGVPQRYHRGFANSHTGAQWFCMAAIG